MSLFSLDTLKKKKVVHGSGAIVVKGSNVMIIGKANAKLEKTIGKISPDQNIFYSSMGDWSTHDLLFFILQHTGPARVYFTTWSISEYAIRQLYLYVEQGLITELSGLFDYRNGIHKPSELQLLKSITSDIKPAKCHAKVVVIENDNHGISIVTSANMTRNPRIEAGVICTFPNVASFHKQWIKHELDNTSDFETDNP